MVRVVALVGLENSRHSVQFLNPAFVVSVTEAGRGACYVRMAGQETTVKVLESAEDLVGRLEIMALPQYAAEAV